MPGRINLGDLPSWIMVLLIGLALSELTSNGILTQYSGLGPVMVFGAVALGLFYFANDVSNKLG
jgi:hypothetical protein